MSADGAAPFSGNKLPIAIEEEMKSAFMDYAMSVIVSRALPDVRDGLKPVHRRILYTQQQMNNVWNRAYIKCARVVGDVLGKFHPHGDTAVYDALVRLAQDFSMRYPLVDGQGNFGSIDGDPPAAYRYTECRMSQASAASCWPTSTRRPSTSSRTTTTRRWSRPSCRRGSRTCSSTAPPASPSAWRRTSRRTTSARSSTRRSLLDQEPRGDARRADGARARAGLPDRRLHLRARRHPRRLRDRPRLHAHARAHEHRGAPQDGPQVDRDHRDPVPGQQGAAASRRSPSSSATSASTASPTSATSRDRDGIRIVIELKTDAVPEVVLEQPLQEDAAAGRPSASTCSRSSTAGRRCCASSSCSQHFIATAATW